MFGLSEKENLQKMIRRICEEQITVYEKLLAEVAERYHRGEFENEREFGNEVFGKRKAYLDAVRSALVEKLKRPGLDDVIEECIENPIPCGINELFSTNGMRNYGIPAGALYAMCLYHKKREFISDADENIVLRLDLFQDKIIQDVIDHID